MELVEFLLARIAEDETGNAPGPEPEGWCDRAEGLHLSHVRVLAECEAKRRAVRACCSVTVTRRVKVRQGVYENRTTYEPSPDDETAEEVLAALSLPYADHPDYRPEWRP